MQVGDTLYKVSVSTGKVQIWRAWTEGNTVTSEYGQKEGKLQQFSYSTESKNVGRSNETDAPMQAIVECKAMYEDQISNKHYHVTEQAAIDSSEYCLEPRKITNYKDRYHKMSDKLLTSVKLNGSRGCVIDGAFYSKIGRKEEVQVPHLRAVLDELGVDATFDSEIYAEGLPLQRIRSAWLKPVKTDKEIIKTAKDYAKKKGDTYQGKFVEDAIEYLGYDPNHDSYKLKFHVFDIPDRSGLTFEQRIEKIREFESMVKGRKLDVYFEFLYPVETSSHEERMKMLDDVYQQGYEGLVHYEPTGVYEFGKRSINTCKSKPRLDAEALVTGTEMCKNGEGKLVLQASNALDNVTFKAMMKGNHTSRMYDVQKQFIGQWVTFDYEELSNAGKPTKPVVRETRPCDNEGNPLN